MVYKGLRWATSAIPEEEILPSAEESHGSVSSFPYTPFQRLKIRSRWQGGVADVGDGDTKNN